MGISASKKVEKKLRESTRFQAAVCTSFEECIAISHHTAAGVFLYQLCDASRRIYDLISSPADHADDPAFLLKQRWLPSPPTQADVDLTLRDGGFAPSGKQFLTLAEFHEFACCLFRDMAVTSAEHRLAMYVPIGSIAMLAVHLSVRRLPAYRSAGLLGPGILGTVMATMLALGFRFP
ncbi:hypothetical protein GOP47_0030486 [Adiantum capillus-veneris]|nr:hypothetical protein GOP47_0030486 [Adiantum capillus-veneris]